MKSISILLTTLVTVSAVPALVWKSGDSSSSAVHSSAPISPLQVFGAILPENKEDPSVVFFLGRSKDGSESLSSLTSQGKLPLVSVQAEHADCYHHVGNMANSYTVAKEAAKARPSSNVVELSLQDFISRNAPVESEVSDTGVPMNKAQFKTQKRATAVANANVFVVTVAATEDPDLVDKAVMQAFDSYHTVVLTAARSTGEVKHERNMEMKKVYEHQQKAGRKIQKRQRRRLDEDADQEAEDNAEEDQEDDLTGVYYVNMTPNILAGILFFLLFTMIAYIGLGCMNMIAGQDVYVTKYPSIGREA